MSKFATAPAKKTAWNLTGFNQISDEKFERQVESLAIPDIEVVTLVELKPILHMQSD